MPTIRVDIESRNEASRQVRDLRERMIELNRTIAENRNRLVGANAEEAKRIRALNQANSALKANISVEMQELRLKQQIINETNREARARETAARAAARQAEQSRQAARELGTGIAATSGLAARQLGQLTVGFVQAASEMETFRNTIQAVTRDAGETDRILQRLLEVSVDLVGIDTGDLIQFSGRLMAVGLTSEEAITAITGVTERIAEQGRPAHETAAALEQVAQSLNSGRARMDDFRPLLRVFPTFWQDVTNALGENVRSTEDFNRVAEASGGHTQTLLRVLTEMARASEGADLSTLNSQLDILNDQSRVLQAELGQHLLPAIVSIVMQINEWIEAFNDLDEGTQKAIAYGALLATGLTALTAVISGTVVAVGALSASLSAITGTAGLGGVATLAGQAGSALGRVVPILGRVASVGGLAVTAITTLTEAWTQIYNAFNQSRPFEDAQESITDFNVAASETARSLGLTAESLSGLSQEARTEIELLTERADQLRTSIRNAINRGDTEGARAFREEYREVNTELQGLITTLPQVATETEAVTESLAEQFIRSADQVIRLRDAFRTVSEGDDIQAIEAAASNLTSALERELALQLMDAELTAADRLDLELSTARAIEGVNRDAQQRISQISQDRSDEEVAAAERQRDARIQSAERSRAAEVAGFERAAESGASYAEQLAMIESVAQRRAFVAIVERLQEQGLSLDEARERAAQFIPVLATVADGVNTADHAFGNFTSTLVRDADLSADAVANLTRNVIALGTAISENLQDDQTFIGFGRDITGRATGTTIESDQAAAGQQGRAFVNRLRERQAREASQRLQRGLSEIQNYAVAVSDVLGSIDNDYADLTSRMAENTASFVRLASGDFTALADVALNVIDFIQDREAHLHEVRMRQAAERLAFETEAAERIRSANTIANALGVDPNQFLTPGQTRFSPGQRGDELGELGLTAPLTTLPTFDLQAIVDSAPDISIGLTGALEQQLTSAIAVAFAHGEPVIEAFQPFFAHLETAMDRAGAAFDTALQRSADPSEIQYRFETLVSETTEFYDLQIRAVQAAATQSGNTARQATFDLIQERDRIINEATNALRQAAPPLASSTRFNLLEQITAGRPAFGADLDAPTDAQEAGLTAEEVAAATEAAQMETTEIVSAGVDDRIEQEQRYLESVTELSERATEARLMADQRLAETQQDTYNDVAEAYEDAENRKTEISERAAEQRANAEQVYVDTVQGIYNDVADAFETAENRKTEISERAAEQRANAEQVYVDTVQGIYNDVADAFEDAEERKIEISERATEARLMADQRLAETQQDTYNDVAEAYEDAENRKTEISERAAEQRANAEQVYVDTVQGIYNDVADAFETAEERRDEITGRAAEDRATADMRYADTVQDIYNDLYLNVVDLQERFNITHADLLQEQSDVEANRLASLEGLHEDHQDRLAEIERDGLQTREDIQRDFSRSIEDILRDAGADESLFRSGDFDSATGSNDIVGLAQLTDQSALRQRLSALGISLGEDDFGQISDLARQNQRDQQDATLRQQREIAASQNQLNSQLIAVNERAATVQEELTTAIRDLTEKLSASITEAETGAGTTFDDAQANFVPAADAMTTALTTLNETLEGIDAGETEALAGVDENFAEFVQAAGVDLPTALANAEPPLTRWAEALEVFNQRSTEIDTVEAEGLAGVQTSLDTFVERAGVPLTDALNNAVEPMDRWTAALDAHRETIAGIDTAEAEARGGVDETFAEVLETAGVPLTEALNNAQEPLSRFAAAGERLSTSLDTINDRESSAIAALDMGLTDFVDRAGVPLTEALNNAVEPMDRWTAALDAHRETIADIDAGETEAIGDVQTFLDDFIDRAGVPLTDALNNAVEPMDRWTQALQTHANAIQGINASELEGIEDAEARNPLAFSAPEAASTAQLESQTAETASTTAITEATTAATASATETTRADTAVTERANATMMSEFFTDFSETPEHLRVAGDRLFEAGDHIIDGIGGSGLIDAARSLQTVADNFHVLVTGNQASVQRLPAAVSAPPVSPTSQGGQQAPVEVVVNVQNSDVILDNQKVGRVIGDTIAQQGANRRNLLG